MHVKTIFFYFIAVSQLATGKKKIMNKALHGQKRNCTEPV